MSYPNEAGEGAGAIDLARFVRACWRHAVWVVLFAVAAALAAGFAYSRLPNVYTATSVVWIDATQSRIVTAGDVMSSLAPTTRGQQRAILSQSSLLTSLPILRRVAAELDLAERPEVLLSRVDLILSTLRTAASGAAEADPSERAADPTRQPTTLAEATTGPQTTTDAAPPASAEIEEGRLQWAAGRLRSNLEVGFDPATELLSVTFTSPDPEMAAAIANAVPAAYVAERSERVRIGAAGAVEWLEARVAALGRDVEEAERRVERFLGENDLVGPGGEDEVARRRTELERRIADARAAAEEAAVRVDRAEAALAAGTSGGDLFRSAELETLQAIRDELTARRLELADQVAPDHRLRVDVERRLARVEESIREEKRRAIADLEVERDRAAARVDRLEDELAAETERQSRLAEARAAANVRLAELEREVEASRALYRDFLSKLKEARQLGTVQGASLHMVAPALPPGGPDGPGAKFVAALAGMGSLALGFGLVLGLEFIDGRIKSREQIAGLGLPVLAVFPRLAQPALARATAGSPPGRGSEARAELMFAEALRRLLSATVLARGRKAIRSLAVASGGRGEGKSTIARAVATLAARSGIATVLVEGDLRRAGAFGARLSDDDPGLGDYLEGRVGLRDMLIVDVASGLHVAPTTRPVQHSTELLASKRMEALLAELGETFAFVVVDTAPAALTADLDVVAPQVDGVVLTVACGVSTRRVAEIAVETIDRVGGELIGVAATRADASLFQDVYGYGDCVYPAEARRRGWFRLPRRAKRRPRAAEGLVQIAHHRDGGAEAGT